MTSGHDRWSFRECIVDFLISMAQFRGSLFAKDRVLKLLSFLVFSSAIGVWYVNSAELSRRQSIMPSYPKLLDLFKSAMFAIMFVFVQWTFRAAATPIARSVVVKRPGWSRELWVAKVDRFTAAIFKLVSSAVGLWILYFWILKDAAWLPVSLFGQGTTEACWGDDFPMQAVDENLRNFVLFAIGFVAADLVLLILKENSKPDFPELVLHLFVTLSLLVFSYLGNFMRLVSLVMMAHLICDVFVYTAKAMVDTKFSGGAFAYFPLLLVHVWFRLSVFANTLLKSAVVEAPKALVAFNIDNEINEKGAGTLWAYICAMLGLSLLLHSYWGFVIVKIGLLLLTTGQSRDLQANLSAMDVREEVKQKKKL